MNFYDFAQKHEKKLVVILLSVIVIALVTSVTLLFLKSINHQAYLGITVAPSEATILVNGQEYNNGNYAVEPGEYQISLSADDYEERELEVTVGDGQSVAVQEFLLPAGETIEYYDDYPDEVEILRSMVQNSEAQEFVGEFDQKYSIEDILPIKYAEYMSDNIDFRIEQGEDEGCEKWFCLIIKDAVGNGKETAYQKIHDSGYNPDDYEIHYIVGTGDAL